MLETKLSGNVGDKTFWEISETTIGDLSMIIMSCAPGERKLLGKYWRQNFLGNIGDHDRRSIHDNYELCSRRTKTSREGIKDSIHDNYEHGSRRFSRNITDPDQGFISFGEKSKILSMVIMKRSRKTLKNIES
jgi:hypothetical protein